ncbi:MAG TPA: FTR1 family protein [bacterium]|nr:FTR1 family protein [bacterium]
MSTTTPGTRAAFAGDMEAGHSTMERVVHAGTGRIVQTALIASAAALVAAVFVWQAVTQGGNPDPTVTRLTPAAAIVDTGILVFREGLEAILVLAAITASLGRAGTAYGRPIAAGATAAFAAAVATWFVVVAVVSSIDAPALFVQAATGLLAVVVLLVIMNWFFHKVYWTGWIVHHTRTQRALVDSADRDPALVFNGLLLLGFSAIYREGFEVVLFLQSIRLQVGQHATLIGAGIGLALTLIVAGLTFVVHHRLPYKKMLVLTGVLLGGVLTVMVGESVQEMQQAGWIGTTALHLHVPAWAGVWLSVYPNVEGLAAQAFAAAFVLGSYWIAEYLRVWRPRRRATATAH